MPFPFSNYTLKYLAMMAHHAFKLLSIDWEKSNRNVCVDTYTSVWEERKRKCKTNVVKWGILEIIGESAISCRVNIISNFWKV